MAGSGRIKGITIEIGGNVTKLNDALKSADKELSSTQSQLKDVNRLLKLDPTNVELLAQKQRLLGDSIKSTKDRLETLKAAQEQAAAKLSTGGKEAQDQYDALRREIISTEAKLGDLEKQASETDAALSGGGAVENIKDTGDAAQDASGKVSGFGSAAKAAGAAAAAAFAAAAAGAVAAAKALVDMTVGGAEYADNILTVSTQTGIATDKLQEYQYAAELVDVSTETLTKSMAKNIKSMKSASDGSAAYADAYKQLGISVTDANGSLRDGDAVYWEAIDALGKIQNETERDALAMQLFGKSAQELNPLIEAGSQRMQELGEQAKAAGYVLSGDTLAAYGALDDNLQYLKVNAEGAKNALGTVLLPVLTELSGTGVSLLADFTNGINAANGDIGKMADVIGDILPEALDAVMAYVPELLGVIGSIVGALGQSIIDNLPAIVDSASSIALAILDGMISNLPQIASGALQLVTALVGGIMANLPALVQAASQVIITLATGIASSLPTMIPTIVDVILQVVQTLIDNAPLLLDAALQLITGLADGLLAALPVLIDALPGIITGIVTFLLDAMPQIIDAGIQLLTSLVAALPEIISAIVEVLPQLIDGIIGALLDALPLIIDAGISLFMALIDALPQVIPSISTAMPRIVTGIVGGLTSHIGDIISAGVTLLTSLISNLPIIISEIAGNMPQIISGMVGALSEGLSSIVEVGKNLVRGLWEGIQQLAGWLWSCVSGWITGIWDGIKDFFGIHSPSRKMAWAGEMIVRGLAGAIDSYGGEAVRAAKALSADVEDAMRVSSDQQISTGFNGTIAGVMPWLQEALAAVSHIPTDVLGGHQSVYTDANSAWGASGNSTVYNHSTSLGGITLYVNAPNVENVESLADMVAEKINNDILNRQAVYDL